MCALVTAATVLGCGDSSTSLRPTSTPTPTASPTASPTPTCFSVPTPFFNFSIKPQRPEVGDFVTITIQTIVSSYLNARVEGLAPVLEAQGPTSVELNDRTGRFAIAAIARAAGTAHLVVSAFYISDLPGPACTDRIFNATSDAFPVVVVERNPP